MRKALEDSAASASFSVLMFANVVHNSASEAVLKVATGCLVVVLSVALLKVVDAARAGRRSA